MDFLSAIRVILRRWYIVAGALVVSAIIAFVVVQSIEPTYEARGSALIVGAPAAATGDEPEPDANLNPFTRLDASTAVLTAVATQIMDDGPTREALVAEGATEDYEVGQATDGTPVFQVVATDTDPDVAIKTVNLVLSRLNQELDDRQAEAGAPEDARVRSIIITDPDSASELLGGRIRAFVAVIALGAAASFSLAFVADAISQSRKARAGAGAGPPTDGEDDADGDPPSDDPAPTVSAIGVPPRPPAPGTTPSADADDSEQSAKAAARWSS